MAMTLSLEVASTTSISIIARAGTIGADELIYSPHLVGLFRIAFQIVLASGLIPSTEKKRVDQVSSQK